MKHRSFICVVISFTVLLGSLFISSPFFSETVNAAETVGQAKKLGSDTISYNYLSDECIQIPCTSRGGIYFLNNEKLVFYSLNDYKSKQVYDFSDDDLYTLDTFATADKLYVLQDSYYTSDEKCIIKVYDLNGQKVERSINVSKSVNSIGVDNSGRIYLAGRDSDSSVNKLYLFSSVGTLLSETTTKEVINDFGAFDSTNGNFYFDGYYNWIYWGYEHDMHALYAGNVSSGKITVNNTPVLLISQEYFYDRQSPMDMLNNKYLCVESTLDSGLYVINSNKVKASDSDDFSNKFISREEDTDEFDNEASIGSRTVYIDKTNTIVTYTDDTAIAEYNPETGDCLGKVKTAYPVFSLLKYNDKIIAIEKSGNDFYLETINWKRADKISITGKNTVKIGSSVQLTASSNGTLSEVYTWSSSNPKVASVSSDGKVFGWSAGSAVITVSTETGVKGTFKITVSSGLPVKNPAKTAVSTKGVKSYNASANNYSVWSGVVNSYMVQNSDNTLVRVEFVNKQVLIETYSSDGSTLKSTKKINAELPLFGGFFSGSDSNFLVFGQNNTSDSAAKEVVRIVKYSKDWKRIGAVSVKGANTHNPFDAGSLRMTETGGKLYVYTCHTMFAEDDGVNHQSNMTFVINESSMKLVDYYYDVMNIAQAGYVSHSFNQFIQTDGRYVYRVDHGDAYPRAISITSCSVSGKVSDVSYTLPISLDNVSGYNPTGASVGGFELSETKCLIAGNAIDYTKTNAEYDDIRDIFISITDKDFSGSSKVVWLTKYTAGSEITVYTPHLVKIGNNEFLTAWEEYNNKTGKINTKFATIDDQGNLTSDIVLSSLRLSDCKPIKCKDGTVRWYVTNNGTPVVYAINPYNLNQVKSNVNKLAAPKINSVSNTTAGVKISWGKVSGAAKYRVFYKNSKGGWTKIADTTGTSYTWKNAKSGTKYTFTVRCISSDGKNYTGDYNKTGKSITYIAAPKINSVSNTTAGVKISWGKVSGAAKYRVFYKNSKGSWTKIADTTGTSYTWKKAKSGTKYTFTVRCISSDGKSYTGDYNKTGKSITYIAAPRLNSVSNTTAGVKISWGKVSGAAKYRVFYKNSKGGWSKIADTTGTSYTWKKAKSGTKYTFTVRCISSDGKSYTGDYNKTGKSITYIAAPKLNSVSNTTAGVKISWGKVSGAAKYRVFYKNSKGGWSKIADTTGTSYTWKKAKSGTKYTFTVRCISSDGKSYTGDYNKTGITIIRK